MREELIIGRNEKVLREKARALSPSEIGSEKTDEIIAKMKRALHQEEDGVAIAAPQIGESLRIFIVKGGLFKRYPEDRVFVNPEIVKRGRKTRAVEEGCLSLRYLYGEVERHERVTLRSLNEKGELITVGATGLLAQIFQHECDHLEGVLFIDKATNVRDLPPLQDEPEGN